MIIQRQKPFEDILKSLEGETKVFVAGCADCAAACKVGGEEEVAEMKRRLEEAGKTVTGTAILDTACQQGAVRQAGRDNEATIADADSVLVLACGTGAQTVNEALEKPTHIGAESLFVGQVLRLGKYSEKCSTCGKCVLEDFEGICPVTRCAKGLLNGPCGGYRDGKCEVDPEKDCAWVQIYKRMEERGKLAKMRTVQSPKDYSTKHTPRSYVWPKRGPQGEKS
jgi:hypothetical protein